MIGVICKAQEGMEGLAKDWVPEAFSEFELKTVFYNVLGCELKEESFNYEAGDILIHFTLEGLPAPQAISFSCARSPENQKLIETIAQALRAKVYDSETGDFLEVGGV